MSSKTVVIVGVGALGSHLAQFLRSCNIKIRIIDFDHIEKKNILSQFHANNSVGKPKVLGLQQLMQFLFGFKLETISNKLVENNVDHLLKGANVIVDCLDNAAGRRLIQDYVRKNNIPCVHGALAPAAQSFGRVIWDDDFSIDSEDGAGLATCENGDQLPFIALVSAYLACSVQEFLVSGKKLGIMAYPKCPSVFL